MIYDLCYLKGKHIRKLNNPKDFIQIILDAKELEIDSISGVLLSIPVYEIMPDDFLRLSREGLLNGCKVILWTLETFWRSSLSSLVTGSDMIRRFGAMLLNVEV